MLIIELFVMEGSKQTAATRTFPTSFVGPNSVSLGGIFSILSSTIGLFS